MTDFRQNFMFQLSEDEYSLISAHLRLQIETSKNSRRGGRRYLPYAFSEQGVAMLSSILRSKRAVMVNIEGIRTFVHLRKLLASNDEHSRKLDAFEKKYDSQFKILFNAIRELMTPPVPKRRPIGFHHEIPPDRTKLRH